MVTFSIFMSKLGLQDEIGNSYFTISAENNQEGRLSCLKTPRINCPITFCDEGIV